jgi:pantoate--beta-alanine ligase
MQVATTVSEAKAICRAWRREGRTIGLVPTMGALHEGHGSLIKRAREENDRVVVSVFVNPTQFAPNEDFDKYPRNFKRDEDYCESLGADLVFHPEPDEMYKDPHCYVNMDLLTETLDGVARPIHFKGVCTVVSKLFNISGADRAYFGEKDAQQLAIVKKMALDLNFDVEVVGCPTVREADGLAKSSRNTYLSPEERKAATVIWRSIQQGQQMIHAGMPSHELEQAMTATIDAEPLMETEYVTVVDALTLQPVETIDRPVLVAIAAHDGKTRLIDNFSWSPEA